MSKIVSLEQFEELIVEYCRDSGKDWDESDPRWVSIVKYAQGRILPWVANGSRFSWFLSKSVEPDYLDLVPPSIAELTSDFFFVLHDMRGKAAMISGEAGAIRKYILASVQRRVLKEAKKMSSGGITNQPSPQFAVKAQKGASVFTEPDINACCLGSLEYGTIITLKKRPSAGSIWAEIKSVGSGKKKMSASRYWQTESDYKAYIPFDLIEECFSVSVGSYENEMINKLSTDNNASFEDSLIHPDIAFAEMMDTALKVFVDKKRGDPKVALFITYNIMNELKGAYGDSFIVSHESELLDYLDAPFISFCIMQEQGKTFNIEDHLSKRYSSLDDIKKKYYGYYHRVLSDSLPYSQLPADAAVAELIGLSFRTGNPNYKPIIQNVVKSYGWARYSERWNVSDLWKRIHKKLKELLRERSGMNHQEDIR